VNSDEILDRSRYPRDMDRRVVVETSGECFPIVTVPGMSPTDQQAGDLMLVFYRGQEIIVGHLLPLEMCVPRLVAPPNVMPLSLHQR
jgi:hypothetical protein